MKECLETRHFSRQNISKTRFFHKFVLHSFNLWIQDGVIRTYLSLFDTSSGRVNKADAAALFELNGKKPIQLVVQRTQRKALEAAVAPTSPWTVDPALTAAVAAAILEYNSVRAPLYPLPKIQRLGYLDEQDDILCEKDLACGDIKFVAGHRYPLRSLTVAVKRRGEKMNLSGELDEVEWNGQELAFFIADESGAECCFMETRLRDPKVTINLFRPGGRKRETDDEPCVIDFTLQDLTGHFAIPVVPDVATVNPAGYHRNLQLLNEIERLVAA